MEKKIGNKVWFHCGRSSGIGLGFDMSKYHVTFNFLFWYAGCEFNWK